MMRTALLSGLKAYLTAMQQIEVITFASRTAAGMDAAANQASAVCLRSLQFQISYLCSRKVQCFSEWVWLTGAHGTMQVSKDTAGRLAEFSKVVEPLRLTLKDHKWLGGESIGYADIAVASMFLVSAMPMKTFAHATPWLFYTRVY